MAYQVIKPFTADAVAYDRGQVVPMAAAGRWRNLDKMVEQRLLRAIPEPEPQTAERKPAPKAKRAKAN